MKAPRLVFAAALMSLAGAALAQSHSGMPTAAPPPSEAQRMFKAMKTLAGSWEGPVSTTPKEDGVEGKPAKVSLRVTSMGNLLLHELSVSGRPDDPITTIYLDDDRLMLTHYCDAGNRPRMVAKVSPDGKKIDFDFLDVAGSLKYGHMQHATFTLIDAGHHVEEWTYGMPDGQTVVAHFDLQRTKSASTVASK